MIIVWFFLVVGAWAEDSAKTNHVSGSGDVARGEELLQAFVIFRHGDRTPDDEELQYSPSSETIDAEKLFFPFGKKALTNKGKQRGACVGKYLRKRYDALISKLYLPDEVVIRTTSYSRTKMTALTALSALYPPPPAQRWNPSLNWQPIPYDTLEFGHDDLMYWYNCPLYTQLRNEAYSDPLVADRIKSYHPLFHSLHQHTGKNITTPEDVFFLDNLFQTLSNVGVNPPEWAIKLMPEIKQVTKLEYETEFLTPMLIKVASGVLLDDILNMTGDFIAGDTDQPKLRLYSAHENNVAALMAASRVFEPHQPSYGSTFGLELWRDKSSGQHIIKAVYAKTAGGPGKELLIQGCGDPCEYNQFVDLVQIYRWTKSEYDSTCKIKYS